MKNFSEKLFPIMLSLSVSTAFADIDADGINDNQDLCPTTKPGTTVNQLGCEVYKPLISQGITFKTASNKLSASSKAILDKVATILQQNSTVQIEVSGHTDSQGSDYTNIKLSQARAEAVRKYLVNQGVSADLITSAGYGNVRPNNNGNDRRVEIAIKQNDADQDGIRDEIDLCTNTPKLSRVDAIGCAADENLTLRGVNFNSGSSELTESSITILERVSKVLKNRKDLIMEVAGHTDVLGDDENNRILSQSRADSVLAFLTSNGVSNAGLTAKGYGETRTIAKGNTKADHTRNRRVEINIIQPDADNDGITDNLDYCKNTSAGISVNEIGCDSYKTLVLKGVKFKSGSDALLKKSYKILKPLAIVLKKHDKLNIEIAGYTDQRGDADKNLDLSQKRSNAVRNYLVTMGVPDKLLSPVGYGETQLLTKGRYWYDYDERNRRVEIKIKKIDADKDGIIDSQDLCTSTPPLSTVNNIGCACDENLTLKGVNFNSGSSELTPESFAILNRVIAALKDRKNLKMEIAGHTDVLGDDENNRVLSQARADSVMTYLVSNGLSADGLTAKGYGEKQTIAKGSTPEDHARNRRVEANIIQPDSDNDGVSDNLDFCKNTASGTKVNVIGCDINAPYILNDINFKTGSATITYFSELKLRKAAKILKKHPKVNFKISGHTDSVGNADKNLNLSNNRAKAVKKFLSLNGLSMERMTAVGYGETMPLDSVKTRSSKNRRVEITLNNSDNTTSANADVDANTTPAQTIELEDSGDDNTVSEEIVQ